MSSPKLSLEMGTRDVVEGVPLRVRLRVEADRPIDKLEVSVFLAASLESRGRHRAVEGQAVTLSFTGLRPGDPETGEIELVPDRLPAPLGAGLIRIRHFLVARCQAGLLQSSYCFEPIAYSRNPPDHPAPAERADPQALEDRNVSLPLWLLTLGSMEAAAAYLAKGPGWPLAVLAGWSGLLAWSWRRQHDFRILQALPEWGYLLPGRKCPIEIVLEAKRDLGPCEAFVSLNLFEWAEWTGESSGAGADRAERLVLIETVPVPALSRGERHSRRIEVEIPGNAPTSFKADHWTIAYHLEMRVGASAGNRWWQPVEMGQPAKAVQFPGSLPFPADPARS
jgi:hypothetical protein